LILKPLNIRSFLLQISAFLAMSLCLISCAQIRPLSGGEKDNEPPKELESTPLNGATHFIEKKIEVQFNEFIKLTNVRSQLIVSPLMETPPEVMVKGKKLIIQLNSELAANTTYSINFGNAISDITENNVFPNYKYVFSTGSFIDSLSYSGSVVDAFDLSKKESTYVLLYDLFEDSIPLKETPRYVALTDKTGNYSLTNIARGKYKAFAIKDINSNYLFDLPNEKIAFKNELVIIDSTVTNNTFYLFEEENQLQFLKKAENKVFGKIDIRLNLPAKNLSVNPLGYSFKKEWYIEEKNTNGDSLTLWLMVKDVFKNLAIEIKDGALVIDTADVKIIQSDKFTDTTLIVSTNLTSRFDLNKNLFITLARPFAHFEKEKILLYEDSVLITTPNIIVVGVNKLEMVYDFKADTEYDLFIPPATFEDIFGLKNDTVYSKFKTKKEAAYGTIKLTITPNFSENYIVQLFKNNKLIKETTLKDQGTINFSYLQPGAYELKLIIDTDNNKKWSTGNYLKGLQPEKVMFYEKPIEIKANWDNDISWTINEDIKELNLSKIK
jgi:hypothetical protein